MNNLLLFFICLFTISLQARYYKADLIYADGTVKSGLAELIDNKTKNIKFKPSKKSKTEKISSQKLSSIIFYNIAGDTLKAERLYNTTVKNNGELRKFDQKEWYYVYYSNGLKIVGGNSTEIDKMFSKGAVKFGSEVSYYLGKESSEDIYYLYYNSPKNLAGLAGFDLNEQIVAVTKQLFQESCPILLSKVQEEKFKFNNVIDKYIELYTSTCK